MQLAVFSCAKYLGISLFSHLMSTILMLHYFELCYSVVRKISCEEHVIAQKNINFLLNFYMRCQFFDFKMLDFSKISSFLCQIFWENVKFLNKNVNFLTRYVKFFNKMFSFFREMLTFWWEMCTFCGNLAYFGLFSL